MVKTKSIKNKKKGFTLIEILIVVSLLGLSLTLTTGILLSVVKTVRKQEILRSVERDGDLAIRQIEENVRRANSVVYDGTDLIVQIPEDSGGVITRYFGNNENPSVCEENYIYFLENTTTGKTDVENRLTNSLDNPVQVTDFTVQLYTDQRPTQLFVRLTLESCYDDSVSKTFKTFVTARGTYY